MEYVAIDAFSIRGVALRNHAPGLVLVFREGMPAAWQQWVGRNVSLTSPSGRKMRVPIDEMKEFGEVMSMFFSSLDSSDFPKGTRVEVLDE
jgi:hypothetical protein